MVSLLFCKVSLLAMNLSFYFFVVFVTQNAVCTFAMIAHIPLSKTSKHLKRQLDPPVNNGHVFGSKVVSWIFLLVTVMFLDQRWSVGYPCP